MNTLLKGEVKFVEQNNFWTIKVEAQWGRKWLLTTIKSQKSDLKPNFNSCSLTQASFLSFLTRSDSFNFYGEKSKYSKLLLESPETGKLMASKNSSIALNGSTLIFTGSVRKKDATSLSNIFILIQRLQAKIDQLNF
ncbi:MULTISPECIES: hypothetical protein [unclassified Algibacter]|uniref:hypothetical protein n=1 Tax=unclassified Algibacter TaxID=2615009 RepID=UPI00131A7052|nr:MULTISPECIES: hypothetical protein [unclassified Algibacter]MCL5129747.1 hypothetical protein [Algibacter sp. L4_22]